MYYYIEDYFLNAIYHKNEEYIFDKKPVVFLSTNFINLAEMTEYMNQGKYFFKHL